MHHHEALLVWQRWLDVGLIAKPFEVVHVDAHSDLGTSGWGHTENTDWSFVLTELLAIPIESRPGADVGFGVLHEGNYLAFALAYGWIDELTMVYPSDAEVRPRFSRLEPESFPNDLIPEFFRDRDPASELIERWPISPVDRRKLELGNAVVRVGPAIKLPCQLRWAADFHRTGFTHMILAESPDFTTEGADLLIPILQEYFLPS